MDQVEMPRGLRLLISAPLRVLLGSPGALLQAAGHRQAGSGGSPGESAGDRKAAPRGDHSSAWSGYSGPFGSGARTYGSHSLWNTRVVVDNLPLGAHTVVAYPSNVLSPCAASVLRSEADVFRRRKTMDRLGYRAKNALSSAFLAHDPLLEVCLRMMWLQPTL